jgi:hypothetical protein
MYIVQCTYCFLYTPTQRSLKAITYEISARECTVGDDILTKQFIPRAHTEERKDWKRLSIHIAPLRSGEGGDSR